MLPKKVTKVQFAELRGSVSFLKKCILQKGVGPYAPSIGIYIISRAASSSSHQDSQQERHVGGVSCGTGWAVANASEIGREAAAGSHPVEKLAKILIPLKSARSSL